LQFEDLESWKRARVLVSDIYTITRDDVIRNDYGLTSQIQRAAVSAMTNLAEGFERSHLAEKLQFYNVARASNGEVRSLLYVIEDNYAALGGDAKQLSSEVISVGKLITGLITSTEKRKKS